MVGFVLYVVNTSPLQFPALRTRNAHTTPSHKSRDGLAVAVVLLSQVAGRVERELICGSHAGCVPISSIQLILYIVDISPTVESDYASRPGDDAPGPDILLAQRVLHSRNDRTDGRGLECRASRVRKCVPWVEDVLVSHGGRVNVNAVSKAVPAPMRLLGAWLGRR